ncbi:MAG: hypothetical protein ACKV2U_15130 [Bryobacteraceae bacterium]
MKKLKKKEASELRTEYERADFPALERGKYVERLRTSSNVVVIDPDVSELFSNADAVNDALRSLSQIAKRARTRRRR